MFAGQSLSVWERSRPKVTKSFSLKLSLVAGLEWRGAVVAKVPFDLEQAQVVGSPGGGNGP